MISIWKKHLVRPCKLSRFRKWSEDIFGSHNLLILDPSHTSWAFWRWHEYQQDHILIERSGGTVRLLASERVHSIEGWYCTEGLWGRGCSQKALSERPQRKTLSIPLPGVVTYKCWTNSATQSRNLYGLQGCIQKVSCIFIQYIIRLNTNRKKKNFTYHYFDD